MAARRTGVAEGAGLGLVRLGPGSRTIRLRTALAHDLVVNRLLGDFSPARPWVSTAAALRASSAVRWSISAGRGSAGRGTHGRQATRSGGEPIAATGWTGARQTGATVEPGVPGA